MPLFQVAVLLLPTKKEKEDGELEKLIIEPQSVISSDATKASMSVFMDNAEKLKEYDKNRLDLVVRPF